MEITAPLLRYLDYLIPFLVVMEESGTSTPQKIKETFLARYDKLIPAGKSTDRANFLDLSGPDLIELGFIETRAGGSWAISEDGRIWLMSQPGYSQAQIEMEHMLGLKEKFSFRQENPRAPIEFTWHGKTFIADKQPLLDAAVEILRKGNPPEALLFTNWYVTIYWKKVSVKWLFHLLTNAEYTEFVTYQAVRVLRKMGIPVEFVQPKDGGKTQAKPEVEKNLVFVNTGANFAELENLVPEKSALIKQARVSHTNNTLDVVFSNLPGTHYAFQFTRDQTQIGFFLQSQTSRINHERIEILKPIAPRWTEILGQEVKAEIWGSRWGRVYISTDRAASLAQAPYDQMARSANLFTQSIGLAGQEHPEWKYSKITEEAFASLLVRFIEATYPDMLTHIIDRRRLPRTARIVAIDQTDDPQAHQLLDQKFNEIRGFLSGRLERTPRDEELCDWIQLCYLFDLPGEGQQLFSFVQPQTLNNEWFYRRTKKYADLCRMKAAIKN